MNDEDFWTARAELATIRDYARARLIGPWSVLGCVLTRVVASTAPQVVLPPLVGSFGSLNLFCAIVGPPGGGEGSSLDAAEELLATPAETVLIRSAREMSASFVRRDRSGTVVMHTDRVMFHLDTPASNRIWPALRSAWSGEALGFQNERTLPVAAGSYRAALTAGRHHRHQLLDDGGTSQRFVWMPTSDPMATRDELDTPAPIEWEPPADFADPGTQRVIEVYSEARDEIDDDMRIRLRGGGETIHAHRMFNRLKVAAALALLNGSTSVRSEDWTLAGIVMDVSDRTRAKVREELA